ncbi:MAG TPA: GGDEF domain-containing protein [Gaiellaceae bacterium]|jgi:diguanylate cyclase (GGDEF)-like protein
MDGTKTRLAARTAAGIYAGAAFIGLLESVIPGGERIAPLPSVAALGIALFIFFVGVHLPMRALFVLGPLGTVLIAIAVGSSPGPGDGAILYVWPVLWTAYFFGTRGAIASVVTTGVAHALAVRVLGADGSIDRWIDVTASVIVVAVVVRLLMHRNDTLVAQLEQQADTDKLTGLLNRRGFENHAAVELRRARRAEESVAVVAIDIDHFKHVNDEWGHETGDRVLEVAGRALIEQARESDVIGRFGGEEFVALLPGTDSAGGERFAERCREAIRLGSGGALPEVRASAGVAAAMAPEAVDRLLQAADAALYAAKSAGRDRTVVGGGSSTHSTLRSPVTV